MFKSLKDSRNEFFKKVTPGNIELNNQDPMLEVRVSFKFNLDDRLNLPTPTLFLALDVCLINLKLIVSPHKAITFF